MSQINSLTFRITLQEQVILNNTSATAGVPGCLDYIPGYILLGVAANRAYTGSVSDAVNDADGWRLFHSGLVRFTDGLPLVSEQILYPMPFSFYQTKEVFPEPSERVVKNLCVLQGGVQQNQEQRQKLKQIRKDYISDSMPAIWFSSLKKQQMKTAVDPRTNRAMEQRLFSMQTLQAGQCFVFSVQLDEQLPESECTKWLKQLQRWLEGEARIGSSRSAEFGKVQIDLISSGDTKTRPAGSSTQADESDKTLTLWLLSDLCLVNQLGQPCLDPQPGLLGLPEGSRLLAEQSFYRCHSYSPFNGKRRCRDPERHVISRGSVLKYQLSESLSDETLQQLQRIGLHQASGLGQVAVNPDLLHRETLSLSKYKSQAISVQAGVKAIESPLTRLLQKRAGTNQREQAVNEQATGLLKELTSALTSARSWQGLTHHQTLTGAPGRSQWGQIKEACNRYRKQPGQLLKMLFEKSDEAIVRNRSGWQLETGPNMPLHEVFENAKTLKALKASDKSDLLPDVIGRTAVLALDGHWQPFIDGSMSQPQGGSYEG